MEVDMPCGHRQVRCEHIERRIVSFSAVFLTSPLSPVIMTLFISGCPYALLAAGTCCGEKSFPVDVFCRARLQSEVLHSVRPRGV